MSFHQGNSVQKQKKCDLPTKMRRRQSDAKWRANVASCYETLKHIIPVNKRASRRQISKAHIIQQTSNHIQFLEEVMSSLLLEKAKKDGAQYPESWKAEKLDEIKEDFINQHQKKLEDLNAEKRYKKKSYKLFLADENIQQNIQQTAQLREALFETHKEMNRGSDVDKDVNVEEINGVNVFTCKDEGQTSFVFPGGVSPEPVDYSLFGITSTDGNENLEYCEVVEEPIDYSVKEEPGPLDLSAHKTGDFIYQSTDFTHETEYQTGDFSHQLGAGSDTSVQNPAVSQFGGHLFVTSSNAVTENTSVHIVPEAVFTQQITSHCESQLERNKDYHIKETSPDPCANDLHLLPPLSDTQPSREPGFEYTSQSELTKPGSHGDESIKTPVKRVRHPDSTPRKLQKTGEATGFTPVKLPASWPDCNNTQEVVGGDSMGHVVCITPIKPTMGRTIETTIKKENGAQRMVGQDADALMCTEEMWMSSDEETETIDERQELTPSHCSHRRTYLRNLKRARHDRSLRQRLTSVSSLSSDSGVKDSRWDQSDQEVPEKRSLSNMKCRRSLQGLYDSDTPTYSPYSKSSFHGDNDQNAASCKSESDDALNETLDFDGYLLFYKKMGAELHENMKAPDQSEEVMDDKMSKLIYESWTNLPHGQKNSLRQLALSEQNSQDSGFCKSPRNMKELEELDNDIWPLPQDIDLNATDEPNIFNPNPLIEGTENDIFAETASLMSQDSGRRNVRCPDVKLSHHLPNSIVCSKEGKPLAKIYPIKIEPDSTPTESESFVTGRIIHGDHTQDSHPDFVLENKDLFLGPDFLCSPSASVDEEVKRYFQDFSPPVASKLAGLH